MRCAAVKTDGSGDQCRAMALKGKRYCVSHDPDSALMMRAARKKGAARTNAKRNGGSGKFRTVSLDDLPVKSLTTLEDCTALASWVPIAIAVGRIDAKTGDVITRSLREARANLKREADDSHREQIAELRSTLEELKVRQEAGT